MEAVHGVTIEEVQSALQRNDGNPLRAEKQLKVRPGSEHGPRDSFSEVYGAINTKNVHLVKIY